MAHPITHAVLFTGQGAARADDDRSANRAAAAVPCVGTDVQAVVLQFESLVLRWGVMLKLDVYVLKFEVCVGGGRGGCEHLLAVSKSEAGHRRSNRCMCRRRRRLS